MKICRTIADTRQFVTSRRELGSVGLVPTMGALHAGHMALVKTAKTAQPTVIASIFVNPTQFGNPEDLKTYPRKDEQDLEMLRAAGVDAVFFPRVEEIYPEGDETILETVALAQVFHGKVRPGHFRGVATVVSKLFNIVQPDAAYFGKKDFQQLAVIKRMVCDLHFPIEIVGVETVRDADGVALSSRNARLSSEHRQAAPILNTALLAAEVMLKSGAGIEAAVRLIEQEIEAEPLADLKAVDVVDPVTFQPVSGIPDSSIGIMVSALFGDVLLIDQREVEL